MSVRGIVRFLVWLVTPADHSHCICHRRARAAGYAPWVW